MFENVNLWREQDATAKYGKMIHARNLLGQRFEGTSIPDAYAVYHTLTPKQWQPCPAHIKGRPRNWIRN